MQGAGEGHKRCTRGVREVFERSTRGALMGTKVVKVFVILAHLRHGWDTSAKGTLEVQKGAHFRQRFKFNELWRH